MIKRSEALPAYIPPHLNGKVMDFRKEPDGRVSFLHPEGAAGLGPEDSRVVLDEENYKQTFDRQHRRANFVDSINNQYAYRRPKPVGQQVNEWIGNKLKGAYNWGTSTQGKGVGTAALLSALAGGAGGLMWGNYTGGGKTKKALLLALLAGGIGAGATAYGQRKHNMREAYINKQASSAIDAVLIRALSNDPTVSGFERSMLLRAISTVPPYQRSELYSLMRTTIGAGAGMLIMRFLKAKGLLPMMAGAILGGIAATPRSPKLKRNAMGQLSMHNYL